MCRFFLFYVIGGGLYIPESRKGEAPYGAQVQAAAGPAALGV